jgi:hypothetical protein
MRQEARLVDRPFCAAALVMTRGLLTGPIIMALPKLLPSKVRRLSTYSSHMACTNLDLLIHADL